MTRTWMAGLIAAGVLLVGGPLAAEPRSGAVNDSVLVASNEAPSEGGSNRPLRVSVPGGEGRITLNVPKGDIREALRLVAEQGGLNISIGPGVEGEVSVFLSDATLDGALQSIAVDNGFAYKVENGIISVGKPPTAADGATAPPLVTRIFTLRCQDAERVRDALEFSLTRFGKMKVLNENSSNNYGTQSLGQLAGDLQGNQNNSSGAVNQQQNNGANSGFGGLTADATTQVPRNARRIIVTDVAENVERIADLIADLDDLPPQVLIEARIVEMSTDLQRALGIDWNINALANGPVLNHELPLQWEAGFASGSQVRRTPTGVARSSTGLALGTIDLSAFTALLQIHEQDNAIRLLANPRLLVFNNHSASILVGERYPILTANITDFGTVTEAFDTYIPVGVQLEVTPTIMVDGRITMMVHPVTSALGDDVVGTTGLRVARIRTRELSTRIVMNDGQTIALGGLISDRNTRQVAKVPGLGDLWGLSTIFRQERPRSERVDLLVFLTANVEGNTQISVRDQKVFDMYEPHFKQIQRSQDVQLHFEIPSEYETPKPMYGDPPATESMDDETTLSTTSSRTKRLDPNPPAAPAAARQPSRRVESQAPATAPTREPRKVISTREAMNDDVPLSIAENRFELARGAGGPAGRNRANAKASDSKSTAREHVVRARKAAGAETRTENARPAENTFSRSTVPSRRTRSNSGGRAVKANTFRVDSHGRPVAMSQSGGAGD